MSSMSKSTPAAYFQQRLKPEWGEMNGMQVAIRFDALEIEAARKKKLGVTDLSYLQRFGVKGPQAAQWLAAQNIQIPDRPNRWLLDNGILVLRLGNAEFLISSTRRFKAVVSVSIKYYVQMPLSLLMAVKY